MYYLFVLWFGWGFTFSVFSSLPLVYSSLSVYPFLSRLMYCNCVHADVCASLQLSLFLPPPCCVVKSLSKCSVFSCFNTSCLILIVPHWKQNIPVIVKHSDNSSCDIRTEYLFTLKKELNQCCLTFEIKHKGGVVYPTARNFQ